MPENTKHNNWDLVKLGANQHLGSANWHFKVPMGTPNFGSIPRAFLTLFFVFLSFLKNIFSIRDHETLS